MKTHLLLSTLLCFYMSANAQNVFDLRFISLEKGFDQSQAKSISLTKESDRPQRFRLTNYNAVLYTPTIKVSSMRFKSVVPDAAKQYVALADFSRGIELDVNLPELPHVTTPKEAIAALDKAYKTRLKSVNDKLAITEDEIRDTEKANAEYKRRKALRHIPSESEQMIEHMLDELMARKTLLEIERSRLERRIYAEEDFIPPLQRTIEQFKHEYNRLMKLDNVLTTLFKTLRISRADTDACETARNQALESLKQLYSPDAQTISQLEAAFQNSLHTCTGLKESVTLQLQNESMVNELAIFEEVDKLLVASEIVNSKKNKLTAAMNIFMSLFPSQTFHESAAYRHKNDYALVSIRLVNNLSPKDTVLKQDLLVFTQNGFDVDFSVGISYDNVYKRTWYVDTVANEVRNEKTFRGNISWAVLINFSKRLNYREKFGISIGPALSLIDGTSRYLLGLHYYYGARDMIGISGGFSFGNRNHLPNSVSNNGTDPVNPVPDVLTEVKPYDKFSSGFFVGIFYNFSRK